MRRWYAPTVLGLLAAGGLAWFSTTLVWAEAASPGEDPAHTATATGADLAPLVGALALVVCAAALGVLAAGIVLRRLIGVLVVLAAAGGLVTVATADYGASGVVDATQTTAVIGAALTEASVTGGPFIAALALVACGALGLVTILGASAWPTMGRRYEAPSVRASAEDDDIWGQLDAGVDPTDRDE